MCTSFKTWMRVALKTCHAATCLRRREQVPGSTETICPRENRNSTTAGPRRAGAVMSRALKHAEKRNDTTLNPKPVLTAVGCSSSSCTQLATQSMTLKMQDFACNPRPHRPWAFSQDTVGQTKSGNGGWQLLAKQLGRFGGS